MAPPAKRAKTEPKAKSKSTITAFFGRKPSTPEPKPLPEPVEAPEPKPLKVPEPKVLETKRKTPTEAELEAAHKLIDLAKQGDWEALFLSLEERPLLVNIRPAVREYGILHQAAFHGAEAAVSKLTNAYSADAELLTRSGQTALQVAKEQGHDKVVTILSGVEELTPEKVRAPKAAEATAGNAGPRPVPDWAADAPDWKLAHNVIDLAKDAKWNELFTELKARPELVNARPVVREYSVLHQAAFHGDQEVVDTLIDKFGADPQAESKFGEQVISIVEGQGHDGLLKSLRKRLGEDSEEEEDDEDFEMVQLPDGSWKIKQKTGACPADGVLPSLTPELIQASHKVIDLAKDGRWKDVFANLDKQKCLVNVRPAMREFGLLHQAAWLGDAEAVANLIKYGADPQLHSKGGKTAAEIATDEGHGAMVEAVLKP